MTVDSIHPGAARTLLVIAPRARRREPGGGTGPGDDFHFIRGFTSNGWRVHFVSPRDSAPSDINMTGYAVHDFFNVFAVTERWPVWLRRVLLPVAFTILATARALQAARHDKPDVVLGQTQFASLAVFLISMVCGVPSAMKLFSAWEPAGIIAGLRIPHDLWIVLDDGTRGDAALRRHGVASEKIRLLPHGLDMSWGTRHDDGSAWRRELAIPDDAGVLLWLAQLVDWKRGAAALRAFALVRDRVPAPQVLVLCGDGPERARLGALADELGVSAAVRFAGAIAHDRVPEAMAAASLFIATSERSNKSIATCEAMLCGVPVVAFDVGGTADVVREGETGRLVPDGDIVALAETIASLLQNERERALLGAAAREFAAARFTAWERRVEMERDLLERLTVAR